MLTSLLVAALAFLSVTMAYFLGKRDVRVAPEQLPISPPQAYDDTAIRADMAQLTQAVANGISQVDRNNRRIENIVRRARKELEAEGLEHPGLEAEAHELQLVDGGGGEEGQLPAVSGVVEPDEEGPGRSAFPGGTLSQLADFRRARGA